MTKTNFTNHLSVDQLFVTAVQHHQVGDYKQAEIIYHHILGLDPAHYLSLNNLGLINLQLGRNNQAEEYFKHAITANSNYYEAHTNLGNLHLRNGCCVPAISSYKEALRIASDDEEVWANLGNAYFKNNQFGQTIKCYQTAIQLNSSRYDLHKMLGNCHYILGQYQDAIRSYKESLKINPRQPELYCKTGLSCQNIGLYERGVECFRRAVALEPDDAELHSQFGTSLLLTGDFMNGWLEYEWRHKMAKYNRHFVKPFWTGEDCDGQTLLIYAEQGVGDTIQFLRFVTLLEDRNLTIVFECPPRLKPLIESWNFLSKKFKVFSIGENLPDFDFYLPLMSLPFLLGLNQIDQISSIAPCQFSICGTDYRYLIKRNENDLKIGLAWAGNPEHARDRDRSIKFTEFSKLLRLKNCSFFSLQVGQARTELYETSNASLRESITDWGQTFTNFFDTAQAISQLDLVITVDTAIAHLSATMGKMTWIMLSANPDWRWLIRRENSPWYPQARLFRQQIFGRWDSVIANIAQNLLKIKKN